MPSSGCDTHGVLGLDAPSLRHVAVDGLDPALGVLAVAAHVPLAHRAARARDGVGTPDDADDEIALREAARGARDRRTATERLVAEHEARSCPVAPSRTHRS